MTQIHVDCLHYIPVHLDQRKETTLGNRRLTVVSV